MEIKKIQQQALNLPHGIIYETKTIANETDAIKKNWEGFSFQASNYPSFYHKM